MDGRGQAPGKGIGKARPRAGAGNRSSAGKAGTGHAGTVNP